MQVGSQEISVIHPSRAIASASMLDTKNFYISAGKELFSSAAEAYDSFGVFCLKMQNDRNLVQYPVDAADSAPYAYYGTDLHNSTNRLRNLTRGGYIEERTTICMLKI
ncbi:hypothetical protein RDI58_010856 [Solanum bulbocastanum]|uniref:Uncharacterized protein n=1 Tax=Solanum bulbocastanum TaxID=147425 RepID=A0AAN8TRC2_SOLBU